MAIGLADSVYLLYNSSDSKNTYSGEGGRVVKLADETAYPTALQFSASGEQLLVGDDRGGIFLYDVETTKRLGHFSGHKNRVCCLSYMNSYVFSSGSRDTNILTHDMRAPEMPSAVDQHHAQEVCSLKWDPSATYLASGGNENIVHVWDVRRSVPLRSLNEHKAAIRALAWSPHNFGLLVSGGGNSDKTIKFWNVSRCEEESVETLHTDSQVCNVVFSEHSNELMSAHGFSKNQMMIWNLDRKERVAVIDAHLSRVLHVACSPDGETVATASADETLKFWTVFPRKNKNTDEGPRFESSYLEIR